MQPAPPQASRGRKASFTDERKEQAVKVRVEGMSLSATARVMGASALTVSKWVKKGGNDDRSFDEAFSVEYKLAAG